MNQSFSATPQTFSSLLDWSGKFLPHFLAMLIGILDTGSAYAQSPKAIPFVWSNTTLNGVLFEKSAMHIPVKFEHDTATYYFQFDTGANRSYLYQGPKSDTSITNRIETDVALASSIGTIKLLSIESNNTYAKDGKTFIGTIGADFLVNKIIEIDFEAQTINVLSSYEDSDYYLEKMELSKGRPSMNLMLDGKQYTFLYDTGSSLFDVWTTKANWLKWREAEAEIQAFPISSWGKYYTSNRALIRTSATQKTPLSENLHYVWYSSNKRFKKIFRQADVSGIIGNRAFLDQSLLIDFKAKKIGVKIDE